MYHVIISAWPTTAADIMVCEETEEVDAKEVYHVSAFQPQIVSTLKSVLERFSDTGVSGCCVYGPQGYVDKIAEDIETAAPELHVTIAKAGE